MTRKSKKKRGSPISQTLSRVVAPGKPTSSPKRGQARKLLPWQLQLVALLKQHNQYRTDDPGGRRRVTSKRTQQRRWDELFQMFWDLKALNCCPGDITNFGGRHVQKLVTHWEIEGLSAGTIQNRLSTLRSFSLWLNKPGLVQPAEHYLADPERARRQYATTTDKSWTTNEVNPTDIIASVMAYDRWVGHQLLALWAFGLRRKEGVFLRPWRADRGTLLFVVNGTKTGRERLVPIGEEQREVLEVLKLAVGPESDAFLSNPELTAKQALARFANTMTKFGITFSKLGVTAHGLRHQRANDEFERLTGVPSPVRGGSPNALSKAQLEFARAAVSEFMGHARTQAASAYIGSFGLKRREGAVALEATPDLMDKRLPPEG